MEQEIKTNGKEILIKLAKLQEDIEYIKSHMKKNEELESEMKDWEETSAEDSADFFEKHNL